MRVMGLRNAPCVVLLQARQSASMPVSPMRRSQDAPPPYAPQLLKSVAAAGSQHARFEVHANASRWAVCAGLQQLLGCETHRQWELIFRIGECFRQMLH